MIRGYKCNHCGNEFVYPKEVDSNVGFAEHPHWEIEYLCPRCRSGNIDEVDLEETEELREEIAYEEEQRDMDAMWEYYYGR